MKRFLFLLCLLPLFIHGFDAGNPHMTLVPPEPENSTIHGLPFGKTPREVSKILAKQGARLKDRQVPDGRGVVQILTFNKLPDPFGAQDGELRLLFFENELIRADFRLDPTYLNFLTSRELLFESLEDRFEVAEAKAHMDDHLRTHLAHLEDGHFDQGDEQAIIDSILEGKTFYYYRITDRRQEFNVSYGFHAIGNPENRQPFLQLHYSLKDQMDRLRAYQKGQ